ncbi:hypothetical protein TWF281_011322 [Arthrobotrys megalospora]
MDPTPNASSDATYSQWFDSIIDYGDGNTVAGCHQRAHPEACQTSSKSDPTKKLKGRRNLSKTSKQALKQWFIKNIDHPYPSEADKQSLSEETGLSVRQISDWFANTRRRRKYKTQPSPVLRQEGLQTASPSPVPIPVTPANWESMTPFDRWRHSPPDQEAAPLSAIADAILTVEAPSHNSRAGSFDSSESSMGTSISSFGSSVSGALSHSSSIVGSGSEGSGPLKGSRRRRRRYRHHSPTKTSRKGLGVADRIYQCTFCTDSFKTKYDWTRHESALHLTLEAWICGGHEGVYVKNDENKCIFCDLTDPSELHLAEHNFDKCAKKPVPSRTFYRKDHLTQHLRTVHGARKITIGMARWKSKMDQVQCRCGFCGERFGLWSERNGHIAEHFIEGAKMKDWEGCRGLDASVALLVENAIPPYLIGTEAKEFEPFSASRKDREPSDHEPSDRELTAEALPTRFEELTMQLSDFITANRAAGNYLSDEDIRREARIIMYGDDDPWNQTPADNKQWLDYFKQGHGISSGGTDPGFSTPTDGVLFDLCTFAADIDPHFGVLFGVNQTAFDYSNLPLNWRTPECLAEMARMQSGASPNCRGI